MQERARLHPLQLSLELDAAPISTARMVLPAEEPTLTTGDLVELYLPQESAGVFRAARVTFDAATGQQTVFLEHGTVLLANAMLRGPLDLAANLPGADGVTTFVGVTGQYTDGAWKLIVYLDLISEDGHKTTYGFRCGSVLPAIVKGSSGWRVRIDRDTAAQGFQYNTSQRAWDGTPTILTVASAMVCECQCLRNAMGTATAAAKLYSTPRYTSGSQTGHVYPVGTRMIVHGQGTQHSDGTGALLYAVSMLDDTVSTGTRRDGWVLASAVQLDEDYAVVDPLAPDEPPIIQVAKRLMTMAGEANPWWAFGRCDFDEVFTYRFADVSLLDALMALPARLTEPWVWRFDQSSLPWLLNLERPRGEMTELRVDRNLVRMQVTLDMTDMYTCVYPVGADGLTIESVNGGEACLTAASAARWGRIEHILSTDDTEPEQLLAAGQLALRKACEPAVSVSISALDLSGLTGEPLDAIRLGKRCRVPLPQYGMTVSETVTHLSWQDLLGAPERVQVTLAERPHTASDLLGTLMRR